MTYRIKRAVNGAYYVQKLIKFFSYGRRMEKYSRVSPFYYSRVGAEAFVDAQTRYCNCGCSCKKKSC